MSLSNQQLKTNESLPSFFRLIDITILVGFLVAICWVYEVPFNNQYLLILGFTSTAFLYFSDSMGLYRKARIVNIAERAMTVFSVVTLSFFSMIMILFLIKESETFSRVVVFSWYVSTMIGLLFWRVAYRKFKVARYKQGKNLKNVAIIGLNKLGKSLGNEILENKELGIELIGYYDDRPAERLEHDSIYLKGNVAEALKLAQSGQVEEVYICLPLAAEKRIASIVRTLSDSTVSVYFVPDFLLNTIMHGNVGNIGHIDTISVFEQPITGSKEFYKRAFDISFSAFILLLISPLLFAISIAVKTTSKGPIFFKQDRYGLDGKRIKVHKFRSMTVMENSDKVVQATKGDARITKVGAFLRRTSLDELPQFYDVLIGRMSVVGPRPHAVSHNEEYRKLVDYYMLRHKVKPGITGWAQINGWRGETDTLEKMEKRIEYDLQYIRNWSLWWDIKIVFLTVFKGFINKNAY